jgi:epoxyqueuosine reductase
MKLKSKAPKEATVNYRQAPCSGNDINGLGETKFRRADYIYHSNGKSGPLPFDDIQHVFRYSVPAKMLPRIIRGAWATFRPHGTLSDNKYEVSDAEKMTQQIKEKALALGAGVVGICELKDEYLVEGAENKYRYAIALGLPMNREKMLTVPGHTAAMEVQRVYTQGSYLTVDLTRYIRSLGWATKALPINSASEYLHIPIAIAAGIGELGKHGSLICKEYGSNFRLTTVVTDLPLVPDKPVDIGVEDICATCQACNRACPPDAIFTEKQWVRGEKKWYVDFDKCMPYFSSTYGCGICLEVCPWSEPGRGPTLSEKLLKLRDKNSDKPATGSSEN